MPRTPSAPLLKKGMKIAFEGDSATNRGSGLTRDTWPYLRLMNWDKDYPAILAEWLFCMRPDLALSFRNAAVGGSTCRAVAERYESCVQPFKPDWVIFTLGGNDRRVGIPLKEFRDTLREYAARLARDSGGRMMALGGFRTCPGMAGSKPRDAAYHRYQRALREEMKKAGGVYVDVGAPLLRRAKQLQKLWDGHTVYGDNHHNIVGNQIIAFECLQALGVLTLHG